MSDIKEINLEEILKKGLDLAPDCFGVMQGDENRVLFCNQTFADVFGTTKEEAVGASTNDLLRTVWESKQGVNISTNDFDNWIEALNAVHNEKQINQFECDLSDGRWFQMTRMNLDCGVKLMFGSDITALKQAQSSLQIANCHIEQLANTDSLTGVYNRRYFEKIAKEEFDRAKRYEHPLSLLVIDIDHFKKINDHFGHKEGDRVLQQFTRVCKDLIRTSDTLCRIGGEEFVILLPETSGKNANQLAERIRVRVDEHSFSLKSSDSTIDVTVSIGIGGNSEADTSFNDIFSRADVALYSAKDGGRNRVVLSF